MWSTQTMKNERVHLSIDLSWDPKKEDRRGALASTFANMAEGIANGRTGGPLPNDGEWVIRKGAEDL
jgi:hypothetical protein